MRNLIVYGTKNLDEMVQCTVTDLIADYLMFNQFKVDYSKTELIEYLKSIPEGDRTPEYKEFLIKCLDLRNSEYSLGQEIIKS